MTRPCLLMTGKHKVRWKNIAGFRDRAIHNYFDIKVDVVWDTLQQDIPELKEKLRIFLDSK